MICSWLKPHSWVNSLQDFKNNTRKIKLFFFQFPCQDLNQSDPIQEEGSACIKKLGKWFGDQREDSLVIWNIPFSVQREENLLSCLCFGLQSCLHNFFSNFTIRHNAVWSLRSVWWAPDNWQVENLLTFLDYPRVKEFPQWLYHSWSVWHNLHWRESTQGETW